MYVTLQISSVNIYFGTVMYDILYYFYYSIQILIIETFNMIWFNQNKFLQDFLKDVRYVVQDVGSLSNGEVFSVFVYFQF
jgi:hypothetical protein